jgi:hypothetical protein
MSLAAIKEHPTMRLIPPSHREEFLAFIDNQLDSSYGEGLEEAECDRNHCDNGDCDHDDCHEYCVNSDDCWCCTSGITCDEINSRLRQLDDKRADAIGKVNEAREALAEAIIAIDAVEEHRDFIYNKLP